MSADDHAPLFVNASASARTDHAGTPLAPLAALVGADYSARAITPQRSDQAPAAVRRVLAKLAPFDATHGIDLAHAGGVVDVGDAGAIRAATWQDAYAAIIDAAARAFDAAAVMVALGGDHSVSWPLVDATRRAARLRLGPAARVGVVQLDAHHDVRPLDAGPSNGTPMRGLIEHGIVRPTELAQIGIHRYANRRALGDWCDAQGIRQWSIDDVYEHGPRRIADAAVEQLGSVDAIHLTVDIDVLDRAHAPGTAAALAGGLDPRSLCQVVERVCEDHRVVAIDVVEFDPQRDVSDITSHAAAAVVMSALSALARRATLEHAPVNEPGEQP